MIERFRRASKDRWYAARALQAYRAGADSDDARVGALLEADHFATMRDFVKSQKG